MHMHIHIYIYINICCSKGKPIAPSGRETDTNAQGVNFKFNSTPRPHSQFHSAPTPLKRPMLTPKRGA